MRLFPIGVCSILIAIACGGGSGGGSVLGSDAITPEEAEPLCRQGCQHDIDCGGSQEIEACTADCVSEVAGWVRGDAFESFVDCTTALDCTASENGCLFDIQPLAIHEQWETRCREAMASCVADPMELNGLCEVSPDPVDEDLGLFRLIAPEIMEEIIPCMDQPDCNARISCVQAVLETHGIDF